MEVVNRSGRAVPLVFDIHPDHVDITQDAVHLDTFLRHPVRDWANQPHTAPITGRRVTLTHDDHGSPQAILPAIGPWTIDPAPLLDLRDHL
jgi:hypothetical protein